MVVRLTWAARALPSFFRPTPSSLPLMVTRITVMCRYAKYSINRGPGSSYGYCPWSAGYQENGLGTVLSTLWHPWRRTVWCQWPATGHRFRKKPALNFPSRPVYNLLQETVWHCSILTNPVSGWKEEGTAVKKAPARSGGGYRLGWNIDVSAGGWRLSGVIANPLILPR